MIKNSIANKQTRVVLNRFEEAGYVDNVWCFNQHILRLGSIIYRLRSMGFEIRTERNLDTTHNTHYYIVSRPKELSPYEVLHGVDVAAKIME